MIRSDRNVRRVRFFFYILIDGPVEKFRFGGGEVLTVVFEFLVTCGTSFGSCSCPRYMTEIDCQWCLQGLGPPFRLGGLPGQ